MFLVGGSALVCFICYAVMGRLACLLTHWVCEPILLWMPLAFVQYLKSAAVIVAMVAAAVSPTLDAVVVLCNGDDGHVAMEFAHGDGACDAEQLHHDQDHAHAADAVCPSPHQCVDESLAMNIAVDGAQVRSVRRSIEASYPVLSVCPPKCETNTEMSSVAARSRPPSLWSRTITVLLI